MSRRVRRWIGAAFLLLLFLLFCILVLCKKVSVNPFFISRYPVQGVDVSRYQGEIDWGVLGGQDIAFAYIKATEGSSYVDPTFAGNWKEAEEAGLYVGAYHFFSFDSGSGRIQGEERFIDRDVFRGSLEELQGFLVP